MKIFAAFVNSHSPFYMVSFFILFNLNFFIDGGHLQKLFAASINGIICHVKPRA